MFSFIFVFLCTSSCVVRVVVHRLIVHDELVADEVEGVGAVAVGAVFELGNLLRAAFRDGVNRLPAVCAVGDAEAELEVVASYQLILEIVALDHAEVINLLRAHAKHQRRAHRLALQKVRWKLIVDGAVCILVLRRDGCVVHGRFICRLVDVKEISLRIVVLCVGWWIGLVRWCAIKKHEEGGRPAGWRQGF